MSIARFNLRSSVAKTYERLYNKTYIIEAAVPGLLSGLRELMKNLGPKTYYAGGADIDVEDLRKKLEIIEDKCAEYDRKGAFDIIAGVKKGGIAYAKINPRCR